MGISSLGISEVVSLSIALPVTAMAILCVWATYASVSPEAAAPVLVLPETAVSTNELYVSTTEIVPEFPVCPDATTEVLNKPPVSTDMTTEVILEPPVCPYMNTEVVLELPICPNVTTEVVPELPVCFESTTEVVHELPFCPEMTRGQPGTPCQSC